MKAKCEPKGPPSHAEYLAAVVAEVDGGHALRKVEVFWYPDNRLRVRIPHGAPAVMNAAYLEGQGRDINIKLAKSPLD